MTAKLRHDETAETGGRESKRAPGGFARRVLGEWKRLGLPSAGDTIVVAVSGGADSAALLLALVELIGARRLALTLKVAHLDHQLRGGAGAEDARHVERLAGGLGLEVEIGRAAVAGRASATGDNLEQAARRARYEFLARAARGAGAPVVLTGHTLDDQAETFLLALLRGSGAGGLGGMTGVRPLDQGEPGVLLARPLLAWAHRADTGNYCESRGVRWREDAMNEDEGFARVRVRRQLLPLLETFNPRAAEAIARAAELLRQDHDALEREARLLLRDAADEGAWEQVARGRAGGGLNQGETSEERAGQIRVPPLRVEVIAGAKMSAVRRRALRRWLALGRGDLRRLEAVHLIAIEGLLNSGRGGRVAELPGGCSVVRRRRWLFFRGPQK